MKLSDLAPTAFAGDPRRDLYVFGLTDDSREVRYGYVFFARPGLQVSGLDFIPQAVKSGAQAVVVPLDTPDEAIGLSDYERTKVAVLRHADVPRFYAHALAKFYPDMPARIAGVTGTNGKTSTVSFIKDLWDFGGRASVGLGTLGLRAKGRVHTDVEATLTTSDPATLHKMLTELACRHGITDLAMEVSSHALDQRRADGIAFDAAVFTNLTQDHLDYHRTMERYFGAKLRLFTELLKPSGTAIVNIDDPHGSAVVAATRRTGRQALTLAQGTTPADLRGIERRAHGAGQVIKAELFGAPYEFEIPVAGAFQMENVLTAIGVAVATGIDPDVAVAGAASLSPIPGRAEQVASLKNGAHVFVDYAHTPDALKTILKSLRPHLGEGGKLHVVFGCGGDRDAAKRPLMGKEAVAGADMVYVTDDNPRTEDAGKIRKAVLEGAKGAKDAGAREEAIEAALGALGPGDILVVAGKGHEDYQILPEPTPDNPIATRKVKFADGEVIRERIEVLGL